MTTEPNSWQQWLANGNPRQTEFKDAPRRIFTTLRCPAEKSLSTAVGEIEEMGASPEFTYCVSEAGRIRDRVADIVDDITERHIDFSEALQKLKQGRRMKRTGWNGKGMFVFMVHGSKFKVNRDPLKSILGEGTEVDYAPHIDIRCADGTIAVWTPQQADMMAHDWVEVT